MINKTYISYNSLLITEISQQNLNYLLFHGQFYTKQVLDVSYKELVKCGAGSVVSQLELGNRRFYLEIPCDGTWKGSLPMLYNATIDEQVVPLEIAELNLELAVEDG